MKKRVLALGAAAVLALSLTACGSSQKTETTAAAADTTAAGSEAAADTTAASGEKTVIKLGVVGENNEQWQPVIDKLAEENIDLEFVKFADYPLPNRALNDGEIDLNSFQHIAYFEDDCKNNLKIAKQTENGFVLKVKTKDNEWTGEEWKDIFDLNSTNFYLENYGDRLRIVTIGKGHSMGMSLYGANALAEKDLSAATILSYYYPGTEIRDMNSDMAAEKKTDSEKK